MQIPTFIVADLPEPEVNEDVAKMRGFALAARGLVDPTDGSALLHGATVLMACLAFNEGDPEAAARDLIAELNDNLATCLRMTGAPVANA